MPVQVPSRTFLMKMVSGSSTSFSNSIKTVIRNLTRKKVFQMFTDIFLVVMLETAETTGVKQDKNNHNLSITHTVGFVTMIGLLILNHIFFLLKCKFLRSEEHTSELQSRE